MHRVLVCALSLLLAGPVFAQDGTKAPKEDPKPVSKLAKHLDDLCPLLPEGMVREVIPSMPATVKHKTGTKRFRQCFYTWRGGRTRTQKIGAMEMQIPINDEVGVGLMRVRKDKDPLAGFKRAYRALTPEEIDRIKKRSQARLDAKVKEGKLSKEAAKSGQKMATGLLASQRYEAVEGVGTAAAWGGTKFSRGLKVLDQDVEFEVTVKVSADEAKNRELAIALAKKILASAR